jgi:peptidylprolyl isomerase
MSIVNKGDKISVHYTGRLTDSSIFDSSEGRDPLSFTVGAGQMIPGFDAGVVGMELGQEKEIIIPPEKAYGIHDPAKIITLPKDQFPADLKIEPGLQLSANQEDGSAIPFVVTEVKESDVMLDGNHVLAGKELIFIVKIVSID